MIIADYLPAGLRDRQSAPRCPRATPARCRGSRMPRSRSTRSSATTASRRRSIASRSDKAVFTVAYIVRAVSPGKYVLPQAYVEDMYRPDRFGRTRRRLGRGRGREVSDGSIKAVGGAQRVAAALMRQRRSRVCRRPSRAGSYSPRPGRRSARTIAFSTVGGRPQRAPAARLTRRPTAAGGCRRPSRTSTRATSSMLIAYEDKRFREH